MHGDLIHHSHLTHHIMYQQQSTPVPTVPTRRTSHPLWPHLFAGMYTSYVPTVPNVPTTPSRFTSATTTGTAGLILCIAPCKVSASNSTPAPPPDLELCRSP